MNKDYKITRWFVLGLDTKIHNTVEAIAPTTYAVALRASKAMKGPESSREPPSSSVGQKRRHDQIDRNNLSYSLTQKRFDRQPCDFRRGQQGSENMSKNRPKCKECGKNYWGQCLAHFGACFRCGKEGNLAKDCLGGHTNDTKNQQRPLRIVDNPTQNRPPVRAYASTSKDTENPYAAMTGTLSILGHLALTLFDSGSTHSFISTIFITQEKFVLESLLHGFSVGTLAGVDMIATYRVKDNHVLVGYGNCGSILLKFSPKPCKYCCGKSTISSAVGAAAVCLLLHVNYDV